MSVPISELAHRLLFGNTLEDKLFRPKSIIDKPSVPLVSAPQAPGRPIEAAWSKNRLAFPNAKQIEEPKERGRALLFFANHELLAIELMALCLLRFPSAPLRFRRGLVNTIYEEQDHFKAYRERAFELGVSFADVSVNQFFWKCLSPMRDPFDFVTGMAMTFEQANLDHCLFYQALFARVGDSRSADIMSTIYADEIRHLRQGVAWFRQWKDPNMSDFEAHTQNLILPLSVARAKGKKFDVSGRRLAGLDEVYIDRLQVAGTSKGRLPNVFLFWPNVEAHISKATLQLPSAAVRIESALEILPIVNASHGDILFLRTMPSAGHLKRLQSFGFVIPQIVEWDGRQWPKELSKRRIQSVEPWGFGPKLAKIIPKPHNRWRSSHRELHSKVWSTSLLKTWLESKDDPWLCRSCEVGTICTDFESVKSAIENYHPSTVVVKAEFGTAGRQTIRVVDNQISQKQQQWLQKVLRIQKVVVEPWLNRALDLSVQMSVHESGHVEVLGWNRFWTTDNGQYRGHWLGSMQKHLPERFRRWMYGAGPRGLRKTIEEVAQFVGGSLHQKGFTGTAGIDMLVSRSQEGYRLRPIVEINPRQTMGLVALRSSRYCRSSDALFLILDSQKANDLIQQFPAQGSGSLESGVLPLNEESSSPRAVIAAGPAALNILNTLRLDRHVQSPTT